MNLPKKIAKSRTENLPRKFFILTGLVFLLKIIIIINIDGNNVGSVQSMHFVKGIWLGADGENYLTGYKSLLSDGVFSDTSILNYWPAGYPLLIFLLSFMGKSWVLVSLAILQSLVFSITALYFARQIFKSRIKDYTYIIYIFIILNPTLTLSTIAIGYESLAASGIMLSSALIVKDFVDKNKSSFIVLICCSSVIYGLIGFIQPRLILTGILVQTLWIVFRGGVSFKLAILILSIFIISILPSALVIRNFVATQSISISTNLGETMAVGAGPGATGGYKKRKMDIPCKISGTAVERDRQITKCAISWHLTNPAQALELFGKKAIYFWSPWTGPLAEGTMARNPWVSLSPAISIARNSTEGYEFITGLGGKIISWLWLIVGSILLIHGSILLSRLKSFERVFAITGIVVILTQMLIAMITVGDHRFRLPIMPWSLLFQAIALQYTFRIKRNSQKSLI